MVRHARPRTAKGGIIIIIIIIITPAHTYTTVYLHAPCLHWSGLVWSRLVRFGSRRSLARCLARLPRPLALKLLFLRVPCSKGELQYHLRNPKLAPAPPSYNPLCFARPSSNDQSTRNPPARQVRQSRPSPSSSSSSAAC